jgi:hypothetical protein
LERDRRHHSHKLHPYSQVILGLFIEIKTGSFASNPFAEQKYTIRSDDHECVTIRRLQFTVQLLVIMCRKLVAELESISNDEDNIEGNTLPNTGQDHRPLQTIENLVDKGERKASLGGDVNITTLAF